MKQTIEKYLNKIYPPKNVLREGEFQYARSAKIESLSARELEKCSSHWKFYKTHLQTAYFEFPQVEILVALDAENPTRIYLLKSLSYEPPDARFFEVFSNCGETTKMGQHKLAHAITALLGSIAVEPEIEALSSNKENEVVFRINQANSSYVDFAYTFNADGRLERILTNGN